MISKVQYNHATVLPLDDSVNTKTILLPRIRISHNFAWDPHLHMHFIHVGILYRIDHSIKAHLLGLGWPGSVGGSASGWIPPKHPKIGRIACTVSFSIPK